jgi:PEP-CTERM motif-containing protein
MRNLLLAGVAVAGIVAGSAAPSRADLILTIADGADVETIAGSGGVASFSSFSPPDPLAGFSFVSATGLSKPILGSSAFPTLDLDMDVVSTSGGTLTFTLSDTDFTGGAGDIIFGNFVGGTFHRGGSLGVQTFMDCDNDADGDGSKLTSQTFSGSSFSGGASANVGKCSGHYSLTEIATLTLPDEAQFSGDASLAVPEPSAIALFGAGLLGLGFALRRKGHQANAAA